MQDRHDGCRVDYEKILQVFAKLRFDLSDHTHAYPPTNPTQEQRHEMRDLIAPNAVAGSMVSAEGKSADMTMIRFDTSDPTRPDPLAKQPQEQ
jgi:hypothetical protein